MYLLLNELLNLQLGLLEVLLSSLAGDDEITVLVAELVVLGLEILGQFGGLLGLLGDLLELFFLQLHLVLGVSDVQQRLDLDVHPPPAPVLESEPLADVLLDQLEAISDKGESERRRGVNMLNY